MPAAKKPGNVSDYIQSAPRDAQKKLREMRSCIRAAASGAMEALK
jgi:hypothetical protein